MNNLPKPGDLLVLKAEVTHLSSRYTSGIITDVRVDPEITRWNGTPEIYLDVLWADGRKETGDHDTILPHYEVVSR